MKNKKAYDVKRSKANLKEPKSGLDPIVETFLKKLKVKDKTGRNLFYHEVKNHIDITHKMNEMSASIPFIARRQKAIGAKWQRMAPKEKEKWDAKAKRANNAKKEAHPDDVYK